MRSSSSLNEHFFFIKKNTHTQELLENPASYIFPEIPLGFLSLCSLSRFFSVFSQISLAANIPTAAKEKQAMDRRRRKQPKTSTCCSEGKASNSFSLFLSKISLWVLPLFLCSLMGFLHFLLSFFVLFLSWTNAILCKLTFPGFYLFRKQPKKMQTLG